MRCRLYLILIVLFSLCWIINWRLRLMDYFLEIVSLNNLIEKGVVFPEHFFERIVLDEPLLKSLFSVCMNVKNNIDFLKISMKSLIFSSELNWVQYIVLIIVWFSDTVCHLRRQTKRFVIFISLNVIFCVSPALNVVIIHVYISVTSLWEKMLHLLGTVKKRSSECDQLHCADWKL